MPLRQLYDMGTSGHCWLALIGMATLFFGLAQQIEN